MSSGKLTSTGGSSAGISSSSVISEQSKRAKAKEAFHAQITNFGEESIYLFYSVTERL